MESKFTNHKVLAIAILILYILITILVLTSLELKQTNDSLSLAKDNQRQKTCSELSSCDEAEQSFKNGNVGLDGNHDGIPCNNICKK